MLNSALDTALAFYARHGAALFPIPAGQKAPTGIVESFIHDHSRDPEQWSHWRAAHPDCNFGVVAFASNWIIIDIDTHTAGRDAGWQAWCDLCASWGVPVAMPHAQSARGGWHIYFQVPEGVDAAALRQPDALKDLVQVRCRGYVVAAGSYYDGTVKGEASGPYVLLSEAAPHPAPDALVAHCTRSTAGTATVRPGARDIGDVAALLSWLNEREVFESYEDWVGVGMALKLEYGDDGLALWDSVTWDDARAALPAKWESFSGEPAAGAVTLSTYLQRAHTLGWKGTVRAAPAAMFGDAVAQLAASAGAALSGPMPMTGGQALFAEIADPILAEFLTGTRDLPTRPLQSADFPQLPDICAGHALFVPLQDCIARVLAAAETPKTWQASRIVEPMAVLQIVHADTYEAVRRRATVNSAVRWPDAPIKRAVTRLEDLVQRSTIKHDAWICDVKGQIEHDNSDNVPVFLGIIGVDIRWNAWLDRAEIRGWEFGDAWIYLDDAAFAKLRTRATRTGTRFRPAKEFLWETLLALAQANPYDPARETLDTLAAQWDGTSRLSTWLSRACGVPCDPYHQAVGRLLIGSIVRRIREPGCKQDEIAVFYGPQGTGKSTLARLLSPCAEWFSDEILLGDAAKELVLSLAGKAVIELSEMGMRGTANAAHVKAMLSRQVDRGRTAYARSVTERPRRNIFIGTTNDDEPLSDPTGNRRFLPVHVEREIDLAWLAEAAPQLLGEAARLHAAGASFILPREVWSAAADRQEAARSASDMEIMFGDWFAETAFTGSVSYVTASDVVRLCQLIGWRGSPSARTTILRRMGFRVESIHLGGKRVKAWVRGTPTRPADVPVIGVRFMVSTGPQGEARVTPSGGA